LGNIQLSGGKISAAQNRPRMENGLKCISKIRFRQKKEHNIRWVYLPTA